MQHKKNHKKIEASSKKNVNMDMGKFVAGVGVSAVLIGHTFLPSGVTAMSFPYQNSPKNGNSLNTQNQIVSTEELKSRALKFLKEGKYKEARKLRKEARVFGELYRVYRKNIYNFEIK